MGGPSAAKSTYECKSCFPRYEFNFDKQTCTPHDKHSCSPTGYYNVVSHKCEPCPTACEQCLHYNYCLVCMQGHEFGGKGRGCEEIQKSESKLGNEIGYFLLGVGLLLSLTCVLKWKKRKNEEKEYKEFNNREEQARLGRNLHVFSHF